MFVFGITESYTVRSIRIPVPDNRVRNKCETVPMFRMAVRPGVELRLYELRQAPLIFDVVERNRGHLRDWLAWVDATQSPDDVAAFIRRGLEQFARNEGFHAGLWCEDRLMGAIGLKPIDWVNERVEIGYWLAADAQGRGLMTDCCRAVIDRAFHEWGLNRIEIRVAAGNERSAAVPRRLGCTLEGVERQAAKLHGRYIDMQKFAVLKCDWPTVADPDSK